MSFLAVNTLDDLHEVLDRSASHALQNLRFVLTWLQPRWNYSLHVFVLTLLGSLGVQGALGEVGRLPGRFLLVLQQLLPLLVRTVRHVVVSLN